MEHIQRAVDSPWPLPLFPSSGPWCHQQPCCSLWMHAGVCMQINAHIYTHMCLSYLVHAPDSSFHRFQACPHLGTSSHQSLTPLVHTLSLGYVWEEAVMPFCLGCFATPEMQEEQWPFNLVEEPFLWLWLLSVGSRQQDMAVPDALTVKTENALWTW